jgi:hypothetical protein
MEANATRANRCARAIDRYSAMHFCDARAMDFHDLLAQACRHYVSELNDNQQDERRMIP